MMKDDNTTNDEEVQIANELFNKIKCCETANYKIDNDRFLDLFDVRSTKDILRIDEKDKKYVLTSELVNIFLTRASIKRENLLYTISLFKENDPYKLTANLPAIGYDLWGSNWTKMHYVAFTIDSAKDTLQSIYEYLTNNQIVYCLNLIKDDNEELYNSDYVKSLVAKARRDFTELQLIIQAASI